MDAAGIEPSSHITLAEQQAEAMEFSEIKNKIKKMPKLHFIKLFTLILTL